MENVETRPVDVQGDGDVFTHAQPSGGPGFRIRVADEKTFSTAVVSPLRHNFHEHPLMQLDRLEELAKFLMPSRRCRFIAPGTKQSSEFRLELKSPDGRDIEDVFRRIEEPGSWIALYHVETEPSYNKLLQEALATVRHLIEPQEPGIFNIFGFMFISAPPSVTPFHIDRENNFWLQIRGRKTMNVWDRKDRDVVSARDLEDFIFNGSLHRLKMRDELVARSHEFDVGPGDGVYFPSTSPHTTRTESGWARPGDGVSISIGINFYTSVTRRTANVHAVNKVLRRLGMQPKPPGVSSLVDSLKFPLGRAVTMLNHHLRGRQMPPGF